MELPQTLRNRDRLVRTALTAGLSVFALSSLRNGKRLRGVLAGLGAIGLGYGASTDAGDGVVDAVDDVGDTADGVVDTGEPSGTDATNEAVRLRCAACGEPIVVGQSRGPDENDEIVHGACLEATA